MNKGEFMKEFEIITPERQSLVNIIVPEDMGQAALINELARQCHEANDKWWVDITTGERLVRNRGEMLMLIVSELAEAFEGIRKDLPDAHLPHRKAAEVEVADALIRLLDFSAGCGYDLGNAFVEKTAYNAKRKDHSIEERLKPGGKKF